MKWNITRELIRGDCWLAVAEISIRVRVGHKSVSPQPRPTLNRRAEVPKSLKGLKKQQIWSWSPEGTLFPEPDGLASGVDGKANGKLATILMLESQHEKSWVVQ